MRLSWQHQPATGRGKIGDGTFGWQLITSLASGRMESPGRQGMGKEQELEKKPDQELLMGPR